MIVNCLMKKTIFILLLTSGYISAYSQYNTLAEIDEINMKRCFDTCFRYFSHKTYGVDIYEKGVLQAKHNIINTDTVYSHFFFSSDSRIDSIRLWRYINGKKYLHTKLYLEYDSNKVQLIKKLYNISNDYLIKFESESVSKFYKNDTLYFTNKYDQVGENINIESINYPSGETDINFISLYDPIKKKKTEYWYYDNVFDQLIEYYYDSQGNIVEKIEFPSIKFKHPKKTTKSTYKYEQDICNSVLRLNSVSNYIKNKFISQIRYIYK